MGRSSKTGLRVVFAGTPDFAVPTLQALLDSSHQVVAVYTQPDRPAGRGRQLQASPVKRLAVAKGLPVFQPQGLKTPEDIAPLRALAPDLMAVVAYGLILPEAVLNIPRHGCLNVHASLLPRWRGAAPIQRAILAGDSQTGVTIMQMDKGLDTGDMLLQEVLSIQPEENAQTLHDRLAGLGAQALLAVLDQIDRGEPPAATAQDDAQANYAEKLSKAEACIDWTEGAEQIARRVRAYDPWPVAYTLFNGQVFKIWQARSAANGGKAGDPGAILSLDGNGITVATGDGGLQLLEVQLAGKRRMPAAEFANARQDRLNTGFRFGR